MNTEELPTPATVQSQKPVLSDTASVDNLEPVMSLSTLLTLLGAVALGALIAVFVMPAWLPGLSTSLSGGEPTAYRYLSTSSGYVAYVLLWLSMVLGLLITNRLARLWPGGPVAFDLHQYTSLLGLAFTLFHALILLGDSRINSPLALLIPFAGARHTFVIGLGQLGFYLMALVGLSFYIRKSLGRSTWRLIHFLSFAVFLFVLWHGLGSSLEHMAAWKGLIYWVSGGSVLFLSIFRVLQSSMSGNAKTMVKHKEAVVK